MTVDRKSREGPIQAVYRIFEGNLEFLDLVDRAEAHLRRAREETRTTGTVSSRRDPILTEDPSGYEELSRSRVELGERPTRRGEYNSVLNIIADQLEGEERGQYTSQVPDTLQAPPVVGRRDSGGRGRRQRHRSHNWMPAPTGLKSGEGRIPEERRPKDVVPVISWPDQIEGLPITTEAIHLGSARVITAGAIGEILARYPNLKILSMGVSYRTIVGEEDDEKIIRKMLRQREVDIVFGRVRDNAYYDKPNLGSDYEARKERYLELFRRVDRKDDMEFMVAHEFLEARIAQAYYGNEQVSLQTIADELGLPHTIVSFRINALDAWAGGEHTNKTIPKAIDNLNRRIQRLRKALENDKEKQKYRRSLAVKATLPPESLPIHLWEHWQKVFAAFQKDQKIFNTLLGPRISEAVRRYFAIGRFEYNQSQDTIAQQLETNQSSVSRMINEALAKLGVLTNKPNMN